MKQEPTEATQGGSMPRLSAVGISGLQAGEDVNNDYLLDASGDQDGYRMLNDSLIVASHQPRLELKDKVLTALQQAGSAGIAPRVEGRICNTTKPSVCLLK